MVADELTRALIEETTLEDISESYRPVVDIIGIEKFIELSEYAKGDELYLGVKDLKAVEDAAKSFSNTWAGTSKADFITASYDIKSGIASLTDEGVAQFTQLAALTGKATKSTTEEMGSLFATGYGSLPEDRQQ